MTLENEIKKLNEIDELLEDFEFSKYSNKSSDPFIDDVINFRNKINDQVDFVQALIDGGKQKKSIEQRLSKSPSNNK